jgi:sucrose-6-phosphate hydrolase SacC (GH32 family)
MEMTLEANKPDQHLNGNSERIEQSSELPLWYHFTPPHGWMNDPCAPGYDAETKLYHIFYQCKEICLLSCVWSQLTDEKYCV